MFCGGFHYPDCDCAACRAKTGMSAKTAYRAERRRRRSLEAMEGSVDMKKPLPGEFQGRKGPILNDPDLRRDTPTLFEFLTAVKYDDGSPRVTGTFLIFLDGGVLKMCINDRDNNRSAFVEAESMFSLWSQAELLMREEELDWKMNRRYSGGGEKPPF